MYKDQKRCFQKFINGQLLVGKYEVYWKQSGGNFELTPPRFGLLIEAVNMDNDNLVLSKSYGNKGSFSIAVAEGAYGSEYEICLGANSNSTYNLLRDYRDRLEVKLEFKSTNSEIDVEGKIRNSRQDMTQLEYKMGDILDMVDQVAGQMMMWKEHEKRFRKASENVNSRVLSWAILQLFLVVFVGIFQTMHMRQFFINKKLV